MGLVSDAFATARAQKHVARKLKGRDQPPQAVKVARPVRRLKKLAEGMPKDVREELMKTVRKGGQLPRQELEKALADAERRQQYVNYDWN